MRCERVPFDDRHLDNIQLKPIFLEGAVANARALAHSSASFMETILCDGKPIAVIGIVCLWPGVATAWSLTAPGVQVAPVGFHKLVLQAIEEYARDLSLHRMQMMVVARFQKNVKWAEALGFANEGRMVKFDSKQQDYFRFARIF